MLRELQCPLMKGPCIERDCRWWIQVLGTNPQTGAPIDKWACAIEFIPILLIENSQQQRSTAGEVEALRKEIAVGMGRALTQQGILP